MKHDVETVAKAEAILDQTLAYQAAQAVHQLKSSLGLDVRRINLEVSPLAHDAGTYRVVCTILALGAAPPMAIERLVRTGDGSNNGNGEQAVA